MRNVAGGRVVTPLRDASSVIRPEEAYEGAGRMNAMTAGDDALSPEDKRRFLRALKSDAAFREEVQKEVLTERLLEVPDRLDRLEGQMAETARQIAELTQTVTGLTAAINALIDHQAELRRDVNGLIETTGRIIHIMEAGFTEMREGFTEMRNRFATMDDKIVGLDGKIDALDTKFTAKLDQVNAEIRDLKKRAS